MEIPTLVTSPEVKNERNPDPKERESVFESIAEANNNDENPSRFITNPNRKDGKNRET